MKEKTIAFIITILVLVGTIGSCLSPQALANEPVYIEGLSINDTIDYKEFDGALESAICKESIKPKSVVSRCESLKVLDNDHIAIPEGTAWTFMDLEEHPESFPDWVKEAQEELHKQVLEEEQQQAHKSVKKTPKKAVATSKDGMTYLYSAYVTGYCPYCAHCCGSTSGITASGQKAVPWGTVASNTLPFGTRIYIDGLGYFTVNDTGGMSGNTIDLCVNTHEEAYAITGSYNIYVVN